MHARPSRLPVRRMQPKGLNGSGNMKPVLRRVNSGEKERNCFMNYVGIDIHKRYSVLAAQDGEGRKLKEARIEGNSVQDYARFFPKFGRAKSGGSGSVLELGTDPRSVGRNRRGGRSGAGSSAQDSPDCGRADQ